MNPKTEKAFAEYIRELPQDPVRFVIPGNAVGKQRHRGNGKRTYTPAETVAYANKIKRIARPEMKGRQIIRRPVEVYIGIHCAIAKSDSKRMQERKMAGILYPTGRPDIDNVEKAIYDALNGVVWKDDSQVVRCTVEKQYSLQPRVEVEIGVL